LVEWSVPKSIRDEVIKENYDILMRAKGHPIAESQGADITEHDLPKS